MMQHREVRSKASFPEASRSLQAFLLAIHSSRSSVNINSPSFLAVQFSFGANCAIILQLIQAPLHPPPAGFCYVSWVAWFLIFFQGGFNLRQPFCTLPKCRDYKCVTLNKQCQVFPARTQLIGYPCYWPLPDSVSYQFLFYMHQHDLVLGMLVYVCNPSRWKVEVGGLGVQSQTGAI